MTMSPLKISGSRPRLVFGCWLLAALLLAGANGSKLMGLLSMPVSGQSVQVRLASEKWRQLQDILSLTAKELAEDVDLDQAFTKLSAEFEARPAGAPDAGTAPVSETKTPAEQLPKLAGVIRCRGIRGNVEAMAVIENRRYKEGEWVREFRIETIEEKGIVLTKEGQRWFLKAPDVFFSFNRQAGTAAGDQ
ncbi:MAG: hypothetical protein WAM61_12250 [Desulfobacterales bacterium]